MMKIHGIDYDKCTSCGECVRECPPRLFLETQVQGEKGAVVFSNPHHSCIHCGHCVCVCPVDAVMFTADGEPLAFPGIGNLPEIISFDNMLSFLMAKRSIRRYQKREVSREEIDAVLKAMQYAPSASNARKWEYIVITNQNERTALAARIVKLIKRLKVIFPLKFLIMPFVPDFIRKSLKGKGLYANMMRLLDDFEQGIDRIFFHAPCIIILHSRSYGHMSGNDAGIALTYGMLAAAARGLGTCWIGYAEESFYLSKSLKKQINIPKNHQVYGVMVMGYPDVAYHRTPIRSPFKVQWMTEDKEEA